MPRERKLLKRKMERKRKMKRNMKKPLKIAELTMMKCTSPVPPRIPEENPPGKMLAPPGSANLPDPQTSLLLPKGEQRS